jgi:hypothetical protein
MANAANIIDRGGVEGAYSDMRHRAEIGVAAVVTF